MNLLAREQIKAILAQENMMMKDLASELGKRLNKNYSLDNLSQKLRKGTISYNEIVLIAEILGYEIGFSKKSE